jgi:hypothetical protein
MVQKSRLASCEMLTPGWRLTALPPIPPWMEGREPPLVPGLSQVHLSHPCSVSTCYGRILVEFVSKQVGALFFFCWLFNNT